MTSMLSAPRPTPGAARRVRALAAAETRLLLRNRTAVVNSVIVPLLLVATVRAMDLETAAGPRLVVVALGTTLVFLTYCNLVTTWVARREDLVLQRMRTGELTEREILAGTAVPTLLVTVVQVAVVAAGVAVLGEWAAPLDVVLPVLALGGGSVLMVLLAAASSALTGTVESAQITTLPLALVATVGSGLIAPLTAFPDPVADVLRLLPMTPVVELAQLGLLGQAWDGATVYPAGAWAHAAVPLAVLAGWLVVAAALARRVFRWAPRR